MAGVSGDLINTLKVYKIEKLKRNEYLSEEVAVCSVEYPVDHAH